MSKDILDCLGEDRSIFPLVYRNTGEPAFISQGMNLREHYAGLAMAAALSQWGDSESPDYIASVATQCADALLAALEGQ